MAAKEIRAAGSQVVARKLASNLARKFATTTFAATAAFPVHPARPAGNRGGGHGSPGFNEDIVLNQNVLLPPYNRLWRTLLVVYLGFLAVVGFWPTPVDEPAQDFLTAALSWLHSHGVPGWFNYSFVEAFANFLLFIPVGILAVMVFPRNKWWQGALIGLTASGLMELGQFLFLDRRDSSPRDLITNTAGTIAGILLVYTLRFWLKKRQAQRDQVR